MPFRVWTIWPLMVSLDSGYYLDALECVRPVQLSKLPALMDASHVNLTDNPASVCRYLTSDSTLVRSYAL